MSRHTLALACLAVFVTTLPFARADGPTSRPANHLRTINSALVSGTTFEQDVSEADYGVSVPIAAALIGPPAPGTRWLMEYLESLHLTVPHFRYVVRRPPGTNADERGPKWSPIEGTGLTVGEFVNYVNGNYAGVQIDTDTTVSQMNPLYVVTLSPPLAAPTTAPAVESPVVRVYSLRDAVLTQRHIRHETEGRATADVLSLLQAVVDATPAGRTARLQVHEPTGMLIVIGHPSVGEAVGNTLSTLNSSGSDNATNMFNENQQQVEDDRQEIERLQDQIRVLRAATRPAAK